MKKYLFPLLLITAFLLSGCVTTKSYQRAYLNDKDMKLRKRKAQRFETAFHTYREAASGANGGKAGGGCGCN